MCLLSDLNIAYAQSADHDAQYKTGERDMATKIYTELGNVLGHTRTDTCITAAIYVRFTISASGKISGLQLFGGRLALAVYGDGIKKAIESSNGQWIPKVVNRKPVESEPMVLPIFIEREDCPKKISVNSFQTDTVSFFLEAFKQSSTKIILLNVIVYRVDS